MRSIYPSGVLDVFLESGFDPFNTCYGVSAGALSLTSFLARKPGRNYRILTRLAVQPEFISLRRIVSRSASVMDLDWLWNAMMEHEPLDPRSALPDFVGQRMQVCCTRVRDGKTVFFRPNAHTWPVLARATCALPMFYRKPVYFAGERWLDGAVSDPLPVEQAWRDGARQIMVIRTRDTAYRKRDSLNNRLAGTTMRQHEAVRRVIGELPARYNRSLDFISTPPAGIEVTQIAPSRPLLTGRTTRNSQALEADYRLGRADAAAYLGQIGFTAVPLPRPGPAHPQPVA